MIYLLIFVAKLIEVSLATIRNVLINRGEKLKGALIGFVEVLIWVIVVSNVLSDVMKDPFRVFVYCLAFSMGNYLGVIIEGKLAIGTASVQAVVAEDKVEELEAILREKGFGVTVVEGHGKDGTVDVLMIYMKRKQVNEAIELIRLYSPTSLVTVNDVRHLSNGYIKK